MRRASGVLVAVLVAGCGGGARQPVELSGPAPAQPSQTMTCVRNELEDMAFTVDPAGGQTNSITATRINEPPWWLRLIGYRATADQITATVEQGRLRVSAISSDPAAGENPEPGSLATEEAARSAEQIMEECGGSGG